MRIPPFLLDQWLATYEFASPPIRYNLASSTGPRWTLSDLLALGSIAEARRQGKLRSEGKVYKVVDGDVLEILHSG